MEDKNFNVPPNQIASQPPITPSPDTKRKTWVTLLITVIAVFAIGAGVYYFGHTNSQKVENSNQQISEWKTYDSQLLGFSLKYPASWGEPKTDTWAKGSSVSFVNDAFYLDNTAYVDPEGTGGYIPVDKVAQQTFQTLSTQKNVTDLTQENINLDGATAIKIS